MLSLNLVVLIFYKLISTPPFIIGEFPKFSFSKIYFITKFFNYLVIFLTILLFDEGIISKGRIHSFINIRL